ncbi:hypothetical protein [Chitinophaga sancti]|uniref:IrrE N-terminal-like domain-containing protein n=1 Tax=Chitinophaga sancti TaxID=1004 RepID=A0A1K1MXE5_9BACT|nr:hypothetical protein [Chitinophaga sancti]WQD63068.1 hypothetical protein U0033_01580 [Chitinophaga sancti]WQG91307.1 hypothetical protein SR876_07335 [Chitinophaga sancti]SFW27713.1 hypothetical protein SAMN05661012_00973 [Chitinophaga sancti]
MIKNEQNDFNKCIAFLNDIGINTSFRALDDSSFLPGLQIENGNIVIDTNMLQYPGDLLHEAGHIAVVPSKDRAGLSATALIKRKDREAEEVMAIAWSYAACIHLDIDPAFVFHKEGYRGGSIDIMDSCDKNEYVGMLMLDSLGMTSATRGQTPYPHMDRWLR